MSGSIIVVEVSLPDKSKVLEVREEFLGKLTSVQYIQDGEIKGIDDLPVPILKQLLIMRTQELMELRGTIDSNYNLLRSKNYFPIPNWLLKTASFTMAHEPFKSPSREEEEIVFTTIGGANKELLNWIASVEGEDMRSHKMTWGKTSEGMSTNTQNS